MHFLGLRRHLCANRNEIYLSLLSISIIYLAILPKQNDTDCFNVQWQSKRYWQAYRNLRWDAALKSVYSPLQNILFIHATMQMCIIQLHTFEYTQSTLEISMCICTLACAADYATISHIYIVAFAQQRFLMHRGSFENPCENTHYR